MKNIKILLTIGLILFSLNFVFAQGSFCCERTTSGAWCIDVSDDSQCNSNYDIAPTHCSSTAYCRLGCCYDIEEGVCMENTPESACDEGKWFSSSDCDIEPCKLGCCLMGGQAAFVTQKRCQTISGLYGLKTNFRSDVGSELQCIATAVADTEGACVYEEEYQTTCKRSTRSECDEMEIDTSFYEGLLCTATQLSTNCEPTGETTCVDGKDGIFYLDNCGNIANIYDADKKDDNAYWTYIAEQKNDIDICELSNDLRNSNDCGNCDYYGGSVCKEYERFKDARAPTTGDYICKDLSCEYKGEIFQHGESWCGFTNPNGDEYKLDEVPNLNLVGGRYYRLVCYNGEVTLEPCADYRQEICSETTIGESGFKNALCIANKWQNCYSQDNEDDCENADARNCVWLGDEDTVPCVPKNAPGLDSSGSSDEAGGICSVASTQIIIECSEDLGGHKDCNNNNIVTDDGIILNSWKDNMNEQCASLGDCGIKRNYALFKGFNDDVDDFIESTKEDLGD